MYTSVLIISPNGTSTSEGYLMLNPVCAGWLVEFYGISNIVDYLLPNPLYTHILNIYDLVWLGFMAYQPVEVI